MTTTQHSRPGFTLVELLVVIAIIAILAGIVIPAVAAMQVNGQNAKTKGLLHEIEGVISTYKLNTGRVPLQDSVEDGSGAALTGDDHRDFFDANESDNIQTIAIGLTKVLATIDQDSFGPTGSMVQEIDLDGGTTGYQIIDAWEQPVFYQPWTSYLNTTKAINPDTFQLWSFGYNTINDVGDVATKQEFDESNPLPYGDDITTWHG